MRPLSSQSDLDDLPDELRTVVETCIQRWDDSGLLCDPDDSAVLLVEPGDSVDDLVAYSSALSALEAEGGLPPFEWVIDAGSVFEAGMVTGGDGSGFSLIVPHGPGIPLRLLDACTQLATLVPTAT